MALAREVAAEANPASVAVSKRLVWADLDLDAVEREETRAHLALLGTDDALEGAAAWRERRAPDWRGKAGDHTGPA
ncbi:hypothetical protein LO762_21590 [Actinocorallia sp. API 0066]|uniref:hypothetical protein n=1 Tax=Actinocorallia sp. API 0066 TaxID=2896846 RepID=UPI001E3A2969|nr:hypothetical protein [Actinocorallia sp. API 0066]MCD0451767.1 hypothetical protein [Actinocorallia sp. API 0066]